jgi:hypothetical protein
MYDRHTEKDRQHLETAKSFKFGDWIVTIPWDGTDPHPGKNESHKPAPTWQGPYKVTGVHTGLGRSDSLIAVIDPADLRPYEFPIARCRLYNLAPGDNPVEIIAWDTDEPLWSKSLTITCLRTDGASGDSSSWHEYSRA